MPGYGQQAQRFFNSAAQQAMSYAQNNQGGLAQAAAAGLVVANGSYIYHSSASVFSGEELEHGYVYTNLWWITAAVTLEAVKSGLQVAPALLDTLKAQGEVALAQLKAQGAGALASLNVKQGDADASDAVPGASAGAPAQ